MVAAGQPAPERERSRAGRGLSSDGAKVAAAVLLLVLTASWIWWALKDGAYVGSLPYPNITLYQGILVFAAVFALLLWKAPWPANLSLSRPARLALWSLVALAVWTGASATWSPTPDIAVADAQRVAAYALAFGLGIWSCVLLGRHMELALLPLAIAGGVAGLVTVVTLLVGDDPQRYLEDDGTLEFPLGYRNATAAFFLIALWPALALAASAEVRKPIRVAALVSATVCLEVAALSQSRGSMLAAVVAVVVYLVLAPRRWRALLWMALAAVPAVVCVPAAIDLYDAARAGTLSGVTDELHGAARAALAGAAIALVAAMVAVWLEPRFGATRTPAWARVGRARARAGAVVAVLVAGVALAVAGDPIGWVDDRADEFLAGEPDLTESSSRFTLNAGSNRSDIWRVSLEAVGDDPLFGDGAGGFQYRYTRERDEELQFAQDAHSAELETLSELGLIGLALLLAAIGGALLAGLRSRRLGPAAGTLSAAALAAGAYWLVHASLDWFWQYPGITAPILALLGAAAAPGLLAIGRADPGRGQRLALLGIVAVLAISVVPPMLSARFTERAYSDFETDPAAAYSDLDRARSWNGLTEAPAMAEGAIARSVGDSERAIAAFREVIDKRPSEWAGHYFLALAYLPDQPDAARAELARVDGLNPLGSPEVKALRERIERATAGRGAARRANVPD